MAESNSMLDSYRISLRISVADDPEIYKFLKNHQFKSQSLAVRSIMKIGATALLNFEKETQQNSLPSLSVDDKKPIETLKTKNKNLKVSNDSKKQNTVRVIHQENKQPVDNKITESTKVEKEINVVEKSDIDDAKNSLRLLMGQF